MRDSWQAAVIQLEEQQKAGAVAIEAFERVAELSQLQDSPTRTAPRIERLLEEVRCTSEASFYIHIVVIIIIIKIMIY